ncbi:MAG: uracil phosphoribosyltransferase [Rhodospirillaceae bacterium]|nr:uracil phosphoribosyltransferase [Rhodospirillaceae bacterium]
MGNSDNNATVRWLLSPEAIREQSGCLYNSAVKDTLQHFQYHPSIMNDVADLVADTTRSNYPDLQIPFHARWRHFIINNEDRSNPIFEHLSKDPLEKARSKVELAITSVLLDAGAGAKWCYRDTSSGLLFSRSEGLALASLNLFASGVFSSNPNKPLQTDNISNFTAAQLADAFQVSKSNPLDGLEGRADLIAKLGVTVNRNTNVFGEERPRLGHLVDYLIKLSAGRQIPAKTILDTILSSFGDIWPGRIKLHGNNLGDCWYHPKAGKSRLVPFHKLSQWLTYSVIEPLLELGVKVTNLDDLTGLAEYRNGGLFIDTGVLSLRDKSMVRKPLNPSHPLVVEWRALTICLLDKIAILVRDRLDKTKEEMPLASVLEGGTWSAGRHVAKQKRQDGTPPISILSDGSVF